MSIGNRCRLESGLVMVEAGPLPRRKNLLDIDWKRSTFGRRLICGRLKVNKNMEVLLLPYVWRTGNVKYFVCSMLTMAANHMRSYQTHASHVLSIPDSIQTSGSASYFPFMQMLIPKPQNQ